MVRQPYPGKRYEECWNHTDGWFTNCKHMTKTRFKQIRASLHWCDNPHSTSRTDSSMTKPKRTENENKSQL